MILLVLVLVVIGWIASRPPRYPIAASELGLGGYVALGAVMLLIGGVIAAGGARWGLIGVCFGVIMILRGVRWWLRW